MMQCNMGIAACDMVNNQLNKLKNFGRRPLAGSEAEPVRMWQQTGGAPVLKAGWGDA